VCVCVFFVGKAQIVVYLTTGVSKLSYFGHMVRKDGLERTVMSGI